MNPQHTDILFGIEYKFHQERVRKEPCTQNTSEACNLSNSQKYLNKSGANNFPLESCKKFSRVYMILRESYSPRIIKIALINMRIKWIQIARTNRHQVWINKIRETVTVTKSNNLVFLTTTNKIHWVSNRESSPWIGKNKDRCNNIITYRCFPHTVLNLLSYQEASIINSNNFKISGIDLINCQALP